MRTVKEWIGKTDDADPPDSVKLRIHVKCLGRCQACERKINHKNPGAMDHIVPLADGGENRESNLQLLCVEPCHADKSGQEAAGRAKTRRLRKKAAGIKRKPKGRHLPGTRASGIRIHMDGSVTKW